VKWLRHPIRITEHAVFQFAVAAHLHLPPPPRSATATARSASSTIAAFFTIDSNLDTNGNVMGNADKATLHFAVTSRLRLGNVA
jgi:hypothetical protein